MGNEFGPKAAGLPPKGRHSDEIESVMSRRSLSVLAEGPADMNGTLASIGENDASAKFAEIPDTALRDRGQAGGRRVTRDLLDVTGHVSGTAPLRNRGINGGLCDEEHRRVGSTDRDGRRPHLR